VRNAKLLSAKCKVTECEIAKLLSAKCKVTECEIAKLLSAKCKVTECEITKLRSIRVVLIGSIAYYYKKYSTLYSIA
jgi:uncharacterized ubiquitin-like protein YukD